jgi:hypothetical protein
VCKALVVAVCMIGSDLCGYCMVLQCVVLRSYKKGAV